MQPQTQLVTWPTAQQQFNLSPVRSVLPPKQAKWASQSGLCLRCSATASTGSLSSDVRNVLRGARSTTQPSRTVHFHLCLTPRSSHCWPFFVFLLAASLHISHFEILHFVTISFFQVSTAGHSEKNRSFDYIICRSVRSWFSPKTLLSHPITPFRTRSIEHPYEHLQNPFQTLEPLFKNPFKRPPSPFKGPLPG